VDWLPMAAEGLLTPLTTAAYVGDEGVTAALRRTREVEG